MSLVLVTGVSGFLGSHVAAQLLKSGYKVRGTVRGGKLNALQKSLGNAYPSLELVQVDDIATGDLTAALNGVEAIVHVASPLPSPAVTPAQLVEMAVGGTTNVLSSAVKKGIKKVVVTSTFGATVDPSLAGAFAGRTITEADWGQVTKEEALDGTHDIMWVYVASKLLAERAVWEFAEKNPSLDVATVNPPFLFGPLVQHFPTPSADGLGTDGFFYAVLSGAAPPLGPPAYIDVRDAARAHVLALRLPPQTPKQNKRFLVSAGDMVFKEVTEHLAATRPELKDRLPSLDKFGGWPGPLSKIDTTRARTVLALEPYISWKDTVRDTVDTLLAAEKTWKAKA